MISTTTTLTVVMASRELASMNKPTTTTSKTLAVRLNGEVGDGLVDCWNALSEMHSCTHEILVFFDGEIDLGLDCCRAINTLCHDCWPSMLTSLGFTSQESDTLRGHCDTTPSVPPQPSPTIVVSPPRPSTTIVVSPPRSTTTITVSPPRTIPINVSSPPPAGCTDSCTGAAHPAVIG
ncbi:hypothetical protein MKW94_005734 [Papaver nudicaule]|uniref:Prolamin-like domain-containing protein n=1 Tax=Papaver nudicaule TaxID=74823 RepID=A0AA42B229_PAPNU|nr:hypothetical protein [Papaver nudicaule]